jgi:uncharacterized lipoprotein YajG
MLKHLKFGKKKKLKQIKKLIKNKKVITMKFLLPLLLLSGCASRSIILKQNSLLPYKEMSQVTKLPFNSKSLALVKIHDNREIKTFGKGYTGVQYEETPVVVDSGFNQFFDDYIVNAFELRNIAVVNDGALELEVDVRELWVEEIVDKFQAEKAKCRANLTFHVKKQDEKWSGNFWTEFTSAGDLSSGSERLAPTLASCMNEIIEKLVVHKEFKNIIQ